MRSITFSTLACWSTRSNRLAFGQSRAHKGSHLPERLPEDECPACCSGDFSWKHGVCNGVLQQARRLPKAT
ncbi:hypothetical protein MRX96_006171 [Rhipicephalus microplus]